MAQISSPSQYVTRRSRRTYKWLKWGYKHAANMRVYRFRFLEMRNLRRRIKLTYKFSDDEDDVSDITDEGSDYEDPDDPPVPKKQKLDSKPAEQKISQQAVAARSTAPQVAPKTTIVQIPCAPQGTMIHLDQLPCSSSVATNPVSNDMTGFMVVSKSTNELTIPGLEPHRINDPADANNTPAVTHDSSSHSSDDDGDKPLKQETKVIESATLIFLNMTKQTIALQETEMDVGLNTDLMLPNSIIEYVAGLKDDGCERTCLKCEHKSSEFYPTMSHMLHHKVWVCRFCCKSFTDVIVFKDHILEHTAEFGLFCSKCKLSKIYKGLLNHVKDEHKGATLVPCTYEICRDILYGYMCHGCGIVKLTKELADDHLQRSISCSDMTKINMSKLIIRKNIHALFKRNLKKFESMRLERMKKRVERQRLVAIEKQKEAERLAKEKEVERLAALEKDVSKFVEDLLEEIENLENPSAVESFNLPDDGSESDIISYLDGADHDSLSDSMEAFSEGNEVNQNSAESCLALAENQDGDQNSAETGTEALVENQDGDHSYAEAGFEAGFEALVKNQDGDQNSAETCSETLIENQDGAQNSAETSSEDLVEKHDGDQNSAETCSGVLVENQDGDQNSAETGIEALVENKDDQNSSETGTEALVESQDGDQNSSETCSEALIEKQDGDQNSAKTGTEALVENKDDQNYSETGTEDLVESQDGDQNYTETCSEALIENRDGDHNYAEAGFEALVKNQDGDQYSAETCSEALIENQDGAQNSAQTSSEALVEKHDGDQNSAETCSGVLVENQDGDQNYTATGTEVLVENQDHQNSAETGIEALIENQDDHNSAETGNEALVENQVGDQNSAETCSEALIENQDGDQNSVDTGSEALVENQSDDQNSAEIGSEALVEVMMIDDSKLHAKSEDAVNKISSLDSTVASPHSGPELHTSYEEPAVGKAVMSEQNNESSDDCEIVFVKKPEVASAKRTVNEFLGEGNSNSTIVKKLFHRPSILQNLDGIPNPISSSPTILVAVNQAINVQVPSIGSRWNQQVHQNAFNNLMSSQSNAVRLLHQPNSCLIQPSLNVIRSSLASQSVNVNQARNVFGSVLPQLVPSGFIVGNQTAVPMHVDIRPQQFIPLQSIRSSGHHANVTMYALNQQFTQQPGNLQLTMPVLLPSSNIPIMADSACPGPSHVSPRQPPLLKPYMVDIESNIIQSVQKVDVQYKSGPEYISPQSTVPEPTVIGVKPEQVQKVVDDVNQQKYQGNSKGVVENKESMETTMKSLDQILSDDDMADVHSSVASPPNFNSFDNSDDSEAPDEKPLTIDDVVMPPDGSSKSKILKRSQDNFGIVPLKATGDNNCVTNSSSNSDLSIPYKNVSFMDEDLGNSEVQCIQDVMEKQYETIIVLSENEDEVVQPSLDVTISETIESASEDEILTKKRRMRILSSSSSSEDESSDDGNRNSQIEINQEDSPTISLEYFPVVALQRIDISTLKINTDSGVKKKYKSANKVLEDTQTRMTQADSISQLCSNDKLNTCSKRKAGNESKSDVSVKRARHRSISPQNENRCHRGSYLESAEPSEESASDDLSDNNTSLDDSSDLDDDNGESPDPVIPPPTLHVESMNNKDILKIDEDSSTDPLYSDPYEKYRKLPQNQDFDNRKSPGPVAQLPAYAEANDKETLDQSCSSDPLAFDTYEKYRQLHQNDSVVDDESPSLGLVTEPQTSYPSSSDALYFDTYEKYRRLNQSKTPVTCDLRNTHSDNAIIISKSQNKTFSHHGQDTQSHITHFLSSRNDENVQPEYSKLNLEQEGNTSTSTSTSGVIDKVIECPQCKQKQPFTESSLTMHLFQHYNVRTYVCGLCNQQFMNQDSINIHAQQDHKRVFVPVRLIRCPDYINKIVSLTFSGKGELTDAEEMQPAGLQPILDKDNHQKAKCSSEPPKQLGTQSPFSNILPNDENYTCVLCGSMYERKVSMGNHIKRKHFPKFKCGVCNMTFGFKYETEMHAKLKHGGNTLILDNPEYDDDRAKSVFIEIINRVRRNLGNVEKHNQNFDSDCVPRTRHRTEETIPKIGEQSKTPEPGVVGRTNVLRKKRKRSVFVHDDQIIPKPYNSLFEFTHMLKLDCIVRVRKLDDELADDFIYY